MVDLKPAHRLGLAGVQGGTGRVAIVMPTVSRHRAFKTLAFFPRTRGAGTRSIDGRGRRTNSRAGNSDEKGRASADRAALADKNTPGRLARGVL
jgi:hypothetical protein